MKKDDTKKVVAVQLDANQLATVLAALRHFQESYENADADEICEAWPNHFEDVAPLGTDDISNLCEELNCSPEPAEPIIFVEGGIVQDVIYPIPSEGKPFTDVAYDLIDYDILEGNPDEDVAEYFEHRSEATKQYMKKHLPAEYAKFKGAIDRHKRRQRRKADK